MFANKVPVIGLQGLECNCRIIVDFVGLVVDLHVVDLHVIDVFILARFIGLIIARFRVDDKDGAVGLPKVKDLQLGKAGIDCFLLEQLGNGFKRVLS